MQVLNSVVAALKGYRTYLAAGSAALAAIAPLFGLLSPATGQAIAGACLGVSVVFHRMATADHALTLADVEKDLSDLSTAVKPLIPAQTPPAA